MIKVVKQLAVFLENHPEALLRLTKDLVERKVNIEALSITDAVDHSVIRMVVDNAALAQTIFKETGVMAVESELIQVFIENKPGHLKEFCEKLSKAGINIEYAYGSDSPVSKKVTLYVRVVDIPKAIAVLSK